MATKLEIATGKATSTMMYGYLVDVVNCTEKFNTPENITLMGLVGMTSVNDESYRAQMIDLVNDAHEWATDGYSDGGPDYYPNIGWSFLTFADKYHHG